MQVDTPRTVTGRTSAGKVPSYCFKKGPIHLQRFGWQLAFINCPLNESEES
jgi:hypothetical protein